MITLFSACILPDRQPPASLVNGRHSVAVVGALCQAARERGVVELAAEAPRPLINTAALAR